MDPRALQKDTCTRNGHASTAIEGNPRPRSKSGAGRGPRVVRRGGASPARGAELLRRTLRFVEKQAKEDPPPRRHF